jgi:hypothetical protein
MVQGVGEVDFDPNEFGQVGFFYEAEPCSPNYEPPISVYVKTLILQIAFFPGISFVFICGDFTMMWQDKWLNDNFAPFALNLFLV